MKISIMWMTSMFLTLLFLTILQKTSKTSKQKKTPWTQFECGMMIMNSPSTPFSLQFFTVALLFLIFDVEIMLMTSYPMEPIMNKKMIIMFTLIMSLTLGLVYEWQKGKILWSKWMGPGGLANPKSWNKSPQPN